MEGQWINIMKNKIAAILLCLGVAINTLCACSSTGNGGDQPAEETTTKQTEAVTEAPTTEEISESETTTTAEPTVAPSGEDVIVPLWNTYLTDLETIKGISPDSWFYSASETVFTYFRTASTDMTYEGIPVFRLCDSEMNPREFILNGPPGDEGESTVEVYLLSMDNSTGIRYKVNGTEYAETFIPLFYNETKQCLVGYYLRGTDNITFSEMYWSPVLNISMIFDVEDLSVYGF